MRAALRPILLNSVPGWVRNAYPADVLPFLSLAAHYYQDLYWVRGRGQCSIDGIQTCTRASTGYAATSSGLLVPFAANTNRRTDLGVLPEQAATNGIRNSTMVGAVAGTPGTLPTNWSIAGGLIGLTQQIIGTGTDTNGLTYIDIKFSGTPNATTDLVVQFDGGTQVAALSGQTWTSSNYLTLSGGSLTNITHIQLDVTEFSAAGGFLTNSTANVSLTSAAARYSLTRTLNQATTAFVMSKVDVGLTNGAAVNLTIRITGPQLELGSFATSYIPTTTVAVTRAADNIVPAGAAANAFKPAAISIFVQSNNVASFAGFPRYIGYSNGHAPLQITNNTKTSAYNGSVELDATLGSGTVTGGTVKTAIGYDDTGRSIVANNGTVATDANVEALGANTVFIGAQSAGGQFLNGYIARLAAFGSRLSDAQLKALTV